MYVFLHPVLMETKKRSF